MSIYTYLLLALGGGSVHQFGLYFSDKRRRESLLKLVGWSVQVQDLDDLGDFQGAAHIADRLDILVGFAGLWRKKKSC